MNHVTQAKRKLKELLIAALPAKLQLADAARADGLQTPIPYRVHTTDKWGLEGYPALELIVSDSSPQGNTLAQVYRHRIVIGITVGGDEEEKITAWIETYMWAIRQVARDTHLTPIEGTAPLDTGGEQYSPLQKPEETVPEPFVKGAFIEVFVTTVE